MEWKRKKRNKCGPFTKPSQYLLLYSLNIVFSCIIKFYSTVKVLLIDTIRIKVRRRSGAEQQRVSLHCCPSQIKPFHAHEMAVRKISTYTGMVLFTLLRSFFLHHKHQAGVLMNTTRPCTIHMDNYASCWRGWLCILSLSVECNLQQFMFEFDTAMTMDCNKNQFITCVGQKMGAHSEACISKLSFHPLCSLENVEKSVTVERDDIYKWIDRRSGSYRFSGLSLRV